MADTFSGARIALAVAVFGCGVTGQGRLAFALLVAAAITDVIDGPIARRRGPSTRGANLDAVADAALLAATAGALVALHPAIAFENGLLLPATLSTYAAGTGATWLAQRRFVDPKQLTAKVAGGALYVFALFTLATGVYVPAVFAIAAGALMVSSADATLRAIVTIQPSWIARRSRSQAPHAANGVGTRNAATTSSASASAPSTVESRP